MSVKVDRRQLLAANWFLVVSLDEHLPVVGATFDVVVVAIIFLAFGV
jgi:hypothetical protein